MNRRQLLLGLKNHAVALAGVALLHPWLWDPPQEERVLFFDDFDGPSLDGSKWSVEHAMRRELDLQLYDRNNVSLENGCLVLTARQEDGTVYSGSVHTAGKFEFGPGTRLAVRAKLEGGYGAWPAIWMQASRFTEEFPHEVWPAGGEIDLMEAYLPGTGLETTLHGYDEADRHTRKSWSLPYVKLDGWHLYEMEWTEKALRFFLDGFLYGEAETDKFRAGNGFMPFCDDTNALFLHLNLAVQRQLRNGDPLEPMKIPPEMRFLIDFVQVTAYRPDPAPVWVAFDRHEITVPQYQNIQLYVHTDPDASDRTVYWQIDGGQVLIPSPSNSVLGNLYAADQGTAQVTVRTPSGGWDVCRVTVV